MPTWDLCEAFYTGSLTLSFFLLTYSERRAEFKSLATVPEYYLGSLSQTLSRGHRDRHWITLQGEEAGCFLLADV